MGPVSTIYSKSRKTAHHALPYFRRDLDAVSELQEPVSFVICYWFGKCSVPLRSVNVLARRVSRLISFCRVFLRAAQLQFGHGCLPGDPG